MKEFIYGLVTGQLLLMCVMAFLMHAAEPGDPTRRRK